MSAELRIPPHSDEAESSVLGGLLLDPEAIHRIANLTADDFYRNDHRIVFRAIHALATEGHALDVVTVFAHLEARGEDAQAGGLPYLNALAQYVPSAGNIRRYAEIVR